MTTGRKTTIFRLVYLGNLPTLLARGMLHAPNFTPNDGFPYRTIHNTQVQASRQTKLVIHDYIPFYFGPLSVMLLNLKTGRVPGYDEGQASLIYLSTTAEDVVASGASFVFSDGHGLANFTEWFDNLKHLDQVDWDLVGARYWADQPDDNDRKRRKQAEFLIWKQLDWCLIQHVGVLDSSAKKSVEEFLGQHPNRNRPEISVRPDWYY